MGSCNSVSLQDQDEIVYGKLEQSPATLLFVHILHDIIFGLSKVLPKIKLAIWLQFFKNFYIHLYPSFFFFFGNVNIYSYFEIIYLKDV